MEQNKIYEAIACNLVKNNSDIQMRENYDKIYYTLLAKGDIKLEDILEKHENNFCDEDLLFEEIEIINDYMIEAINFIIEQDYEDCDCKTLQEIIECGEYEDIIQMALDGAYDDMDIPYKYWNGYYEGDWRIYNYLNDYTRELIEERIDTESI